MFKDFFNRIKQDRFLMILVILMVIEGPFTGLLTGGIGGLMDWIMDTLVIIPGLLIGLSFHEFAHAKVAVLCGDNTPLYYGRVTVDPAAHIDPVGLFSLLFLGFGWGKPVMVNPRNFKNYRRDDFFVGIAGVTMNFFIAILFSLIIRVLIRLTGGFLSTAIGGVLLDVLFSIISINLSLMLFNLLPVPPLDGYNIFGDLFGLHSKSWYRTIYSNSRYILLMILILKIPSLVISPLYSGIMGFIINHIIY